MELAFFIILVLIIYVKIDDHNIAKKAEYKQNKIQKTNRKKFAKLFDDDFDKVMQKHDKLSDEENIYTQTQKKTQKKNPAIDYQKWLKTKRTYLQSAAWKHKRQERLKLDNYSCKVCTKNKTIQTNEKLEIHHLTYKNLKKEAMRDIVSLCREHHQLQHDTHGYYVKGYHRLIYK